MIVPKLGNNKFVLIRSKATTGHVLNIDGSFYFEDDGKDYFEVIVGEESAIARCSDLVSNGSNLEITLHDGEGKFVQFFRPEIIIEAKQDTPRTRLSSAVALLRLRSKKDIR